MISFGRLVRLTKWPQEGGFPNTFNSIKRLKPYVHSCSFVSMKITFVAMSALIPLLANASVAFFGEPNLTKCIFLTARVTVAMILKVNLTKIR